MATSYSIEKLFSIMINFSLCFRFFYFFLLLLNICSQIAVSHSVVKFLPGFDGPLPFYFETGYVGVGESEEVQYFYYFVKSESNPKEDPLVLWLTGGPGCTAFSGFIYEIGPLNFKEVQYNGSLPNLVLNPNSWTKVASILFLDQPVGTGFSYAKTKSASQTNDLQTCDHVYQFLQKWLIDHPEFASNPIYVGGDSYSGITVPIIVQMMSNGNEAGIQPSINLKGYLLGNPLTVPDIESNYQIPFAHGMGLISDELYKSLNTSCSGEYTNVNPSNAICLQYIEVFNQLTSGIQFGNILDPLCGFASPRPHEVLFGKKRFLEEKLIKEPLEPRLSLSAFTCHIDWYRLYYPWITDVGVQEALHVRKGTTRILKRCDHDLPYEITIWDSYPYHVNLSTKGYRSLIYSGDHDMIVPFLATQSWIRSLSYPIVDDWRPWTVQNQVGGYTRTYSNQMTFATVKGGGHTAPEYRPKECFAMFKRWIAHEPL